MGVTPLRGERDALVELFVVLASSDVAMGVTPLRGERDALVELFVFLASSDVAMGVTPLRGERDALDDQPQLLQERSDYNN